METRSLHQCTYIYIVSIETSYPVLFPRKKNKPHSYDQSRGFGCASGRDLSLDGSKESSHDVVQDCVWTWGSGSTSLNRCNLVGLDVQSQEFYVKACQFDSARKFGLLAMAPGGPCVDLGVGVSGFRVKGRAECEKVYISVCVCLCMGACAFLWIARFCALFARPC